MDMGNIVIFAGIFVIMCIVCCICYLVYGMFAALRYILRVIKSGVSIKEYNKCPDYYNSKYYTITKKMKGE